MSNNRDALWASGHDESVEVNQRALIDKVLARYSGEFTVFRELLQNSDDARAKSVEIRFETKDYLARKAQTKDVTTADAPVPQDASGTRGELHKLPNLKTAMVHQWSFRNNGIVFRDEDWNRLKKIAEGNPDEEKIGAFGVGFYSLFSVTEEPFVTSGDKWMGFYWKDKGDQLFARRGTLAATESTPNPENNPWTTFEMELREPTPIPSAFDFTRFLASSITFMTSLSEVSLYFDDKRLAHLTKSPGVPKQLPLPKGLRASSDHNMMHVRSIQSTPLHITASVMRWVHTAGTEKPPPPATQLKPAPAQGGFFSSLFSSFGGATPSRAATPLPPAPPPPPADPREVIDTSVVLDIFTAEVSVTLDQKITAELVRSTKKNPPQKLKFELIYTGKDAYDASKKEDELQPQATGSVFQGLRADLEGTGSARVFIGHATGQTTGIGGHMAARFIPTVERESIDLVDRNVAVWNRQLLYVGGYLARCAYEMEMSSIQNLWNGAAATGAPDAELQAWLRGRSLHAMQFFTFHRSTPSMEVSADLEKAFFTCGGSAPFLLMSTVGVRGAADVRLPDAKFAAFLKQLPVLPDGWQDGGLVAALQRRGLLKPTSPEDVLRELGQRPLPEREMVACMKWWMGEAKDSSGRNQNVVRFRDRLLEVAILSLGQAGSADERIIPLSSVKTYINAKKLGGLLPGDGPLPAHVLPPEFSKHFNPDMLSTAFNWSELSLLDWVKHLVSPAVGQANIEHDITRSAPWAEKVLMVLSRAWVALPQDQKTGIIALLGDKACVPTSAGLRVPSDAYTPNVNLFPDLPVVTLPSGAPVKKDVERVLVDLKVRRTVDLQIVFDRMYKTGDWSSGELVKYLVSVRENLSQDEMAKLRQTPAFPTEKPPADGAKPVKYKASQLYEPTDAHRELGLPVIDWVAKAKWRPASDEAKFLYNIGLRRFPPLKDIIQLAASPDEAIRQKALRYFFENFTSRYSNYNPDDFATVSFVPALDGKVSRLGSPKEVFGGSEWSALGFLVVEPNLRNEALTKVKIREHPPTSSLVALLQRTPPTDPPTAQKWFSVLAGRVSDFSPAELKRLQDISFVPAVGADGVLKMRRPVECHFTGQSRAQYHSKLFVFVDFGQPANGFLSACGTKHAPSVEEIAQLMLDDPPRFYKLAEGRDNYVNELRNFANNGKSLSSTTIARMKRSKILLGSRRVKKDAPAQKDSKRVTSQDLDEDDWEYEHDLLRPEEIVIVDDINEHQLFGDSVFIAPQEEQLEAFYLSLGSRRLTAVVREEYKTSAELKATQKANKIRGIVLERLPLFLHEHTHTRPRRPYSWFHEGDHFIVRTFGKIEVAKSLTMGVKPPSRTMDASAVGKPVGNSQFQLWLADNIEVDLYEVATSVNRFLFDAPKPSDSLLFMTILSTDLTSLRRRGYNVDRILRQQRAEREAAEEAKKAVAVETEKQLVSEKARLVSDPPSGFKPGPQPVNALPTPIQEIPQDEHDPLLPNQPEGSKRASRPQSMINSLQKLKKHLTPGKSESIAEAPNAMDGLVPQPSLGNEPRAPSPRPGVTPLSNIQANIDTAVQACRQEQGNILHNRQQMQMVKESLKDGYCDFSAHADDLMHIGDMGGVKIYASRDVPDATGLMQTKRDAIARFIHIVNPLRQVYSLPTSSLHIFYDTSGDLIAFNRNASIFLNLRFYEAWHDQDVQQGHMTTAFTSWYFSLGHEIAHNLVHPHNAEHEFWFSAICEQHMEAFAKLLSRSHA